MPTAPRQRIHLRIADIPGRRFELRHRIEDPDPETLELTMATWCPGSYFVREYAGHVAWLRAERDGRALPCEKTDKSTWKIAPGPGPVEIIYQLFAAELTVRSNDIAADHAFVHPPSTFLAARGRENEPIAVEIEAPDGWNVATTLPEHDGARLARDLDHLLDCPIEMGPHTVHRFEAGGAPHELVVYGSGNLEVERAVADAARICEYEIDLWGERPFERYLFILHLTHDRGGGLEHCDNSVLAWAKLGFKPEKEYRSFLTLVAHEYFHAWNVKRIRPEVLLQYDLSRETYTRLLWVFEGITSYYDTLIPMRAGCYEAKHHFEFLAEHIRSEQGRPGRLVHSLGDSSFDTWIKLYRMSPDAINAQTNYYEKGMLVSMLLDLHLRERTDGDRTLDDVMRHLWSQFYKRGRGVPEDGMAAIIEEATGVDVSGFLRTHVEEPGALDYAAPLASVGLRLAPKKEEGDDDAPKAWWGATPGRGEANNTLASVTHDGPAHRGGLMNGDEVIALGGHRIRRDLEGALKAFAPGQTVRWAAFRRDRLVEGELTFGEDPNPPLEIVPLESVGDAQKRAFAAWTAVEWDTAWAHLQKKA